MAAKSLPPPLILSKLGGGTSRSQLCQRIASRSDRKLLIVNRKWWKWRGAASLELLCIGRKAGGFPQGKRQSRKGSGRAAREAAEPQGEWQSRKGSGTAAREAAEREEKRPR